MGSQRSHARPTPTGRTSGAPAPTKRAPAVRRRPTSTLDGPAVLDLQAGIGNRAVASVLGPAVQRQPRPRMTAGWDKADTAADGGPGWNAAARDNVEGTGIRRIPVDNIAAGNQLQWSPNYNTAKGDDAQSEKNRTTETAAGRAIVLKPAGLDVNRPIDVLLHLHGYTSRRGDPAAGWRQSKVAVTKDGKSYKPVRDIDQDRIAQQLATVTRSNPQTLGILPQGVGHSFFGADFVPRTYIDAVVDRLQQIKELPAPTAGSLQTNLILSAHSGGGHTVGKALRAELDAAKAEAKAAAQAAKKGGKAPAGPATPALNPTQVVLFEAINNGSELATVTEWVYLHLNRTRDALVAAGNPISKSLIIAGCPTLRAYRSRDGYKSAYDDLDAAIGRWFTTPALGGKLSTVEKDLLRQRFRVEVLHGVSNIPKGLSGHEQVVGGLGTPEQGPLADALAARTDPSSSKLLKGPPPKAKPVKGQPAKGGATGQIPHTTDQGVRHHHCVRHDHGGCRHRTGDRLRFPCSRGHRGRLDAGRARRHPAHRRDRIRDDQQHRPDAGRPGPGHVSEPGRQRPGPGRRAAAAALRLGRRQGDRHLRAAAGRG